MNKINLLMKNKSVTIHFFIADSSINLITQSDLFLNRLKMSYFS